MCLGKKGGIGPKKGSRTVGFGDLVGLGVVGGLVVLVSAVSLRDESIWNPVWSAMYSTMCKAPRGSMYPYRPRTVPFECLDSSLND